MKSDPMLTYKRSSTVLNNVGNGVTEFLAFRAMELSGSDFNYIGWHDQEEEEEEAGGLSDVHLTVDPERRTQNVPFVCLTSKSNGQAVIGYPVEIEVLSDSYETSAPRNKPAMKLSDRKGGKSCPLVWNIAKRSRTPVCYVADSVSSASGNRRGGEASKNSLVTKEQLLEKCKKQQIKFEQAPTESCVPVERIFSRILAAVGHV